MLLFGIAGKARSGKDTVAKYLEDSYRFHRMSFAGPLKLATHCMFDIEHVPDSEKEAEARFWGVSPRQMYQGVGDAMKDKFGRDFWVKRWQKEYSELAHIVDIVVSDVRFEEEAQTIRACGGHIIHLARPGAGLAGAEGLHNSEAGVEYDESDYVIHNEGSKDDLYEKLDKIMERL